MQASHLIFLAFVFVVVIVLVLVAMAVFAPGALRERLASVEGKSEPSALDANGWVERVAKVAQPFSRLSLPEEGWEKSALRTRFMTAGLRNPAAPALYFGAKSVLALATPAFIAFGLIAAGSKVAGAQFMFVLLLGAAMGYYLPNVVLGRLAERRRREIFENIPDALDLLTVCVEAGLSLERALIKVAGEIHIKSLVLAQELQLVLMEMRAGFTKEKALRNFALRSGVEDVDTLVAMMIQSERFGTSMGDSLRVHSDNLRTKRRMIAEECAAKIGLKLLFPLIFCIFPILLMVLLGPAGIQIGRTLLPAMGGTN
ncbi:type II secretion system F family protein [Massilia glaciei]|uniref:Type II secretion system F family protein n=1 Tax=Massilia glaciei TaxID=1524097 RepID=A0A2U2I6A6_9BURK|nr:type II secretion system F family protein [Massilia glaciei]PWF55195.1 type II secretion system F family protein [Massilia glaciei]